MIPNTFLDQITLANGCVTALHWGNPSGLFYAGNGPPSPSLGRVGDFYLDLVEGILYELF